MTEDTLIQQMRDMRYPGQVDVVDAVMAQVSNRPILSPVALRAQRWHRAAMAAAACALLAVGINMTVMQTRHFDVKSISGCLAEVYDYHSDYTYESAADEDSAIEEDVLMY